MQTIKILLLTSLIMFSNTYVSANTINMAPIITYLLSSDSFVGVPPPVFHQQNSTLDLSSDTHIFTFDSNADWTQNINSVSISINGTSTTIPLENDDYTIVDGILTLNVATSSNVALHLPYPQGINIILSAVDYADAIIVIDTVEGGIYEAKAILSSVNQLEENTLDDAIVSVSLTNSLKFADDILDSSNFTLQGAPPGLTIRAIEYVNHRYANLTLAFDGTDINTSKQLSITISKDELSSPKDIDTNSLTIQKNIISGYNDLNKTVAFHTSDFIHLSITATEDLILSSLPKEGNVSSYKIGNEYWALDYNHTSCNLRDRIVYDSTNGKGKINIDVEMSLATVSDGNISINSGSSLYEYTLVNDPNVKGVYIYPPQHGSANIVLRDGKYLLNYTPDGDFIGTEKLSVTINSELDTCIISSNFLVTINVSLVEDYEMFSAYSADGACIPYVTDGITTREVSGIGFQGCGSEDYTKFGGKFIFTNIGGSPLYRVNPATLAFSSWSAHYVNDPSLTVRRAIYDFNSFLGPIYPQYQSAFIYTTSVDNIGRMPWALRTTGDPYLIADSIGEVDGDKIVSNYMQDYTYFTGYRQAGSHVYAASYDYANGSGLALIKACAFEGDNTCTSGGAVRYNEVNSTKSNGGGDEVYVAVDKHNFVYTIDKVYQDNSWKYNLWVTVDLNLDVLSMTDQTRYMENVNFSSLRMKRASNGLVYYDGFNVDTNSREIGHFIDEYNIYSPTSCFSGCTEAYMESVIVEKFFEGTTILNKIISLDSYGDFFIAGDKLYVSIGYRSTITGRTLYTYLYELDMDGTLTLLPAQTDEDSKAWFKYGWSTIEYINGYIYMIGSDKYNSSINKMISIDTKNNNAVTLIEFDKEITLYNNGIYNNDYNFHKVIYRTEEIDSNGDTIFNVYGYNPYKNEKTLLKTYPSIYN